MPIIRFIRWIILLCFTVVIGYALIEGMSLGAYYYVYKKSFSYKEIRHAQKELIGSSEGEKLDIEKPTKLSDSKSFVQHPYLGYVWEQSARAEGVLKLKKKSTGINAYGFISERDEEFIDTSPDTINIIMTGGSVAVQCILHSRAALLDRLETIPAFKGKKLHLVPLATFAYKQPQELLSLIYYQTLGGRVDLLINLDGFNELFLPAQMIVQGISPYYPIFWQYLGILDVSPDYFYTVSHIYKERKLRDYLATLAHKLSVSVTVDILWKLTDSILEKDITKNHQMLVENVAQKKSFIPGPPFPQTEDMGKKLDEVNVQVWKTSTLQMQAIAASVGAPYFHFLQPNQYVKDSKTFSANEKVIAVGGIPEPVAAGYPRLRAEMPALRKAGIHIHDLTNIYKNVREDIYIDPCCHVNNKGSDMIMKAIGDEIVNYYQQQPKP